MSFMDTSINHLIQKIVDTLPEEKKASQDVIIYGLKILIGDTIKMILILILAYIAGLFWYIALSILIMGILRSFAGGVHANSWFGCFVSVVFINFGTVLFSLLFTLWMPRSVNTALLIALILFNFAVLWVYAPGDHSNKPIVSKRQRKNLRAYSLVIMGVIVVFSFLSSHTLSNILIFSSFIECITILPLTYRLTGNRHGDAYFEQTAKTAE